MYPNGNRPVRQAGPGYWKATGPDKVIRDNGNNIGGRKSLVYYEGRAPNFRKTNWMMHEFVVEAQINNHMYDLNADDFDLFGDTISCGFMGKIEQVDVDESKKHI
ncbi:hypothetical protein QVD17_11693 [Tagetes erecta]|uniref:NAC domain-containing protein n=1 Tax=Tagetes erecta TaxID=13708 RepID=A0AAD8P295_TARER|nr:hypothetical protein QVD17_11693 [Tagetes erecta]